MLRTSTLGMRCFAPLSMTGASALFLVMLSGAKHLHTHRASMSTAQQQAEALAAGLYAHQVEGIAFLLGRQRFAIFLPGIPFEVGTKQGTYQVTLTAENVRTRRGADLTIELVAPSDDRRSVSSLKFRVCNRGPIFTESWGAFRCSVRLRILLRKITKNPHVITNRSPITPSFVRLK